MKTFRLLFAGALALLALAACKKEEEPDDNGNTPSGTVYDDAYYAANASIGSSSLQFSANDEGGTISFKAEGGSVVVEVDCGADWTVDNDSEDLFGAEVNIGAGTLVVTADQNYVEEALTGTLTLLTATDRISFAVITVNQEAYGSPEISIETNEVSFPAVGELTAEVGVESSLEDFDVENTAEWLTVEKTDDGVSITATENETVEERTADITVSCTDGHLTGSDIIRVTQDAHAYVTLSSERLTFASTEGTSSVTVEANYDWAYTLDDEYDWLTVATDGDQITVTVVENPSDADRTATITVSSSDGVENCAEAQLTVYQSETTLPMILTYTTTDASTTITLPLYGDVDCLVDWGDGSDIEAVTTAQPTHTYESAGAYDISVSGSVSQLYQKNLYSSAAKGDQYLTAVKQWGNVGLTSLNYAFSYSINLKTLPETTGNGLSKVTNFDFAFNYCKALEAIPEDLFAKNTELTGLTCTFYYCSALTEIPEGLFQYNTNLETISQLFAYCNLVTTVPEGLFQNNINVTKMCPFYYMQGLESVPENIFAKNVKVTDFSSAFCDCKVLAEVPAGLFKNNPLAESFKETFKWCYALETVPGDLFKYNPAATDFSTLFEFCTGFKEIPTGLFDYNEEATNFENMFNGCTALTTIPEGLFKNNVNTVYVDRTFYGCTALESVPDGLFSGLSKCTTCDEVFWQCTSIKEIPADLFKGMTSLSSAYGIFYGCKALEAIPEGLFDDLTSVLTFWRAFYQCSALASIPSKLFANCTALSIDSGHTYYYGLYSAFYQCTSLQSVPEDIMPVTSNDVDMRYVFYGCTSLTSIPEHIFDGLTGSTMFSYAFFNCTSLTSIPAGLFDNNTKIDNFQQTFYKCSNLTGESPYTVIDGNKVHLYERVNYPDNFAEPTTTTNCFSSCTGLDDYNSIPSAWGGGGN